jgi:hypothetical protein
MSEYDDLYKVAFDIYEKMNGSQAGDPVRAAELMIEVANHPEPPLRLPMGQFAYDEIDLYIESLHDTKEDWKDKLLATDYPKE